ncbi:MAG: RHS repeat-associated core domain-containing protein [Pseudomonadota bacterium]
MQKVIATTTSTETCVPVTCPGGGSGPNALQRNKTRAGVGGTCQSCTTTNNTTYETIWLHTDYQGSVSVETDKNATPVPGSTASYKPYGDWLTQPMHNESLGYTGQRRDSSTSLLYLHARYYDPVLGRFISPDPLTPGKSVVHLNRYAYADNDPINKIDVTGMQSDGTASGPIDFNKVVEADLAYQFGFPQPPVGFHAEDPGSISMPENVYSPSWSYEQQGVRSLMAIPVEMGNFAGWVTGSPAIAKATESLISLGMVYAAWKLAKQELNKPVEVSDKAPTWGGRMDMKKYMRSYEPTPELPSSFGGVQKTSTKGIPYSPRTSGKGPKPDPVEEFKKKGGYVVPEVVVTPPPKKDYVRINGCL